MCRGCSRRRWRRGKLCRVRGLWLRRKDDDTRIRVEDGGEDELKGALYGAMGAFECIHTEPDEA